MILAIENYNNELSEIPQTEDMLAVFIMGQSGCVYYSKIDSNATNIVEKEGYIGGFISAIFAFSKEIIGKNSGAMLKEINFGNQLFYLINKNNVIFAYLIKNVNPLIEKYMYIVANGFLDKYNDQIKDFNGDLSPFNDFEDKFCQYFKIGV